MRKLEKWLEKYGPQVDQLMREVALAASKEGRVLGWMDVPVEGTIKPDGFNVTVMKKESDQRGGFVEVPVMKQHFNSEAEAEKALAELRKQFADKPEMIVAKEKNDKIEFSPNPGFLLGGRKLAPGEEEFNLREFRFKAKEVQKDGEKMIAVTSTQKFQYSWCPYDLIASDKKTTISGTEQQPVYYKPDDWVVVMDGGRTMMMQAKNLPRFETEGASWHYGMKGAGMAMDIGFIALGGFEGAAIWRTAAKEATAQGVKMAVSTGIKEIALSRASWHGFLGVTGVMGRPIEAGFGHYGHEFMKYRSYAMLTDITMNTLPLGDSLRKAWAASRGAAFVERQSAVKNLLDASKLHSATQWGLLGTEVVMIGDILGKAIPDMLAQTKQENLSKQLEQAKQYRGPVFAPDTPTMLKIDSLIKETDKVKALEAGSAKRKTEEAALTNRLTTSFLDSKNPEERLAAGMALISLKGKQGTASSDVIGSRHRDNKVENVTLADVQKFLSEYQRGRLGTLLTQYDAQMSVKPPELSLKRTAEILSLPENSQERQQHIEKLSATFNQLKTIEDKVDELQASLDKAKQDRKDAERKSTDEKAKLDANVTSLSGQLSKAKADWDAADKKQGVAAAIGLISLGLNKENGQLSRTLGNAKGQDVINFLERQAKTSSSSDAKYVVGDMLFRMGRADIWQLGSICQDILKDNGIKDQVQARNLKIAALFNENAPRLGELLELMRHDIEPKLDRLPDAGDRARALAHTYGRDSQAYQETLLAVIRNQKEDSDVRAMAARLLLTCSAGSKEERQTMLQQCRDDWQKFSAEPGRFSKQFIQTLKSDLTRNTDGGDDAQRQQLMDRKFRAAVALSELGGPAELGIDAEIRSKTTQSLIDCFDYTQPAIALQVLPHLVPKRLGELAPQQLKDVRDTFQQMLGAGIEANRNTPDAIANAQSRTPLRIAVIEKLPQILAGANDQQRAEIANTLKGIISYDDRYRNFFAAASPELRAATIKTLTELSVNAPEATRAGTVKLYNSLLGMAEAQKRDASPDVRLAALNALEKLKATDLQATALKLLKVEKDPLVLEKLWSLEYSERRPDLNSKRSMAAFESAKRKLLEGVEATSLKDGKDLIDQLMNTGTIAQRQVWWQTLAKQAQGDGADAQVARRALAHMVLSGQKDPLDYAARTLAEICEKEGPKAGKEMANLIERCLLSSPRLHASARSHLLHALDLLKPGTVGSPISREDAAVVVATVLERDLRNLPRHNVPENPLDNRTLTVDTANYRSAEHIGLQIEAIRYLQKYASDKVIPILESLAEDNIARDPSGRPIKVTYPNGTSKEFVYEGATAGYVKQVIEQPSGEVWTRGDLSGQLFTWTSNKGGKRQSREEVVLRSGEYSYEDEKKVRHTFADNGSEVQAKSGQVLRVTYPDGKGRSFTYETVDDRFAPGGKLTRIRSVTEFPNGETWTRSDKDKNTFTNSKGETMRSYCEFVKGNSYAYGSRGGELGTFCRVTRLGNGSVMEVFTPSGAELQVKNGAVTEVAPGAVKHSVHPSSEIRESAKTLLALLRDGSDLTSAQAKEQHLQSAEQSKKNAQQLADDVAKVLVDNRVDSATVCRAVFASCIANPISSVEDPRRFILQQAMKDAHPQVRAAAARVLFERSDLKSDREQAVVVLTDIEKNGSRLAYRKDAANFLGAVTAVRNKDAFHPDDWKLVWDARKNTPDSPHKEPEKIRQTVELLDETDSEFQRAFERAKVELSKDDHKALSMSWDQWHKWYVEHDLRLLEPVNFAQLQHSAARKRWEGHSWEWKTSSWAYIREEEQKARDAQIPYFWAQFNQLVDKARTKGDKDPEGMESREALAYIIMSGGESFNPQLSKDSVKKAADGILDICKGKGPGRGDLAWALKTCLVEQPKLDHAIRGTLLKALDELVAPNGNVSKESAANIAALALEAEFRNMPKQGEEGYDASIRLQSDLLDRIKANGNRDMTPVLDAIAKFHRSDEIKRKAAELCQQMKK